MEQWFYNDAGEQRGPVSREELKGLLSSGTISPATPVWKAGLDKWTVAGKIPELVGPAEFFPYAPPAEIHPRWWTGAAMRHPVHRSGRGFVFGQGPGIFFFSASLRAWRR